MIDGPSHCSEITNTFYERNGWKDSVTHNRCSKSCEELDVCDGGEGKL